MEGRNRFRALPQTVHSIPKRILAFLLTAALILTNAGADMNTVFAAASQQSITFQMNGSALVKSIDDTIAGGKEVTAEDLDFTNGKVAEFNKLLFEKGKLYEIFPDIEGGGMDAELRMFVRLPEDADDMYIVTGDEEVIFLYVNNGGDTISLSAEIIRTDGGVQKVQKTRRVTVKSYQEAYGNEEVDLISKPAQMPVPAQDGIKGPDSEETIEWDDKAAVTDEAAIVYHYAPVVSDYEDGGEPEVTKVKESQAKTSAESGDLVTTESQTGPSQPAGEETTTEVNGEAAVPGAEETTPAPVESGSADASENTTGLPLGSDECSNHATSSTAREDEVGKHISRAGESGLVGMGYCSAAKVYVTTINQLKALDDFNGYKVSYAIYPEASARIMDGVKGVEEGRRLTFGVKNQIGYEVDCVTINDAAIEADSVTDNNDGSRTAWYSVSDVNEKQGIEVYMSETGEHPQFSAALPMEDGTIIRLSAEEGILPAGVSAAASAVPGIEDTVKEKVEAKAQLAGDNKEVIAALSYNIDLLDQKGRKLDDRIWNGSVQVIFTGTPIEENSKNADSLEVMYVATTKEDEVQANVTPADVVAVESASDSVAVAGGQSVSQVAFDTEHFSVYTVTFTKNGNTASVSIKAVQDDKKGNEIGTIKKSIPYFSDTQAVKSVTDMSNVVLKDLNLTGYTLARATVGEGKNAPEFKALRMSPAGFVEYLDKADMQYKPVMEHTLYFWYQVETGKEITFKPNGGDGEKFTLTAVSDGKGNFHFSTPDPVNYGISRKGYEFVGWSLNKDGNALASDDKVNNAGNWIPNVDVTVSGKQTYYAVWLDDNEKKPVKAYFYISTADIPFEPSKGNGNAKYIPNARCIDKGYRNHDLQGTLKAGISVNNDKEAVNANIKDAPDDDRIADFVDHYNSRHETNLSFDPETQEIEWYVIKYVPYEWHVDGAVRNKGDHSVMYHPNGGNEDVPLKSSYGKETSVNVSFNPIPARNGYTFLGWDRRASAAEPRYAEGGTDSFAMPDEDVTLYAIWRPDQPRFTVEHYKQSGGFGRPDRELAKSDFILDTREEKTAFKDDIVSDQEYQKTYPGYTYKENIVDGVHSAVVTSEETTLRLYYTCNMYQVSYSMSGAERPLNVSGVPEAKEQPYGGPVAVAEDLTTTDTKNGAGLTGKWTFNGWSTDDVSHTGGIFKMPNHDVKFQGTWSFKVNEHQVSYSVEGEEPESYTPVIPKESAKAEGSTVSVEQELITAETRNAAGQKGSWKFDGWSSDQVSFESGSFTMPAGNVKFTGKWIFTALPFSEGNTGGGGSSGGGGSHSGGAGSGHYEPTDRGGPGIITIITPQDVPLAQLPGMPADMTLIDDGEIPLAALPKTGQNSLKSTFIMMVSGIFLVLMTIGKKRKEDDS